VLAETASIRVKRPSFGLVFPAGGLYDSPVSFVTVSYAQSVDGCIATANGGSKWISSEATLTMAQEFRRDNSAILVGAGTVCVDDPLLTCRLSGSDSPIRAILDTNLRVPKSSQVVQTATEVPTIIFCSERAPLEREEVLAKEGVEVVRLAFESDKIPLKGVLGELASRGLQTIFVEGGGTVITSFLRARLVDRLVAVVAPMFIGDGVRSCYDLGVSTLHDAIRPRLTSVHRMGDDSVFDFSFGAQ